MTTKKLSELEVLKALGEGTYAVVEENGEAKRYPAGGFGAVKSVNGITPDEAGNVAVKIPVVPAPTWESLPDKPFYEETTQEYIVETTDPSTLENQSLDGNVGYCSYKVIGSSSPLEYGKKYVVEYDGQSYTSYCRSYWIEGVTYEWVGTSTESGGSYPWVNSDYPVAFGSVNGEFRVYLFDEEIQSVALLLQTSNIMPLDSKYLPKAAALPDVSDAPTAEDFNALLASLRAAGYMNS